MFWFILGFFIGGFVGIMIMCLCMAQKDNFSVRPAEYPMSDPQSKQK